MISIHHISDTHSRYIIPRESDILIHSGDFCNIGNEKEIDKFLENISEIRKYYKRVLVIPGNHDRLLESQSSLYKDRFYNEGIDLVINNVLEINIDNKNILFGGISYIPLIYNTWSFELNYESRKRFYKIFPKVDILISHSPVKFSSVLGDELIDKYLIRNKVRYHFCGHIHEHNGVYLNKNFISINSATVENILNINL